MRTLSWTLIGALFGLIAGLAIGYSYPSATGPAFGILGSAALVTSLLSGLKAQKEQR